MTSRLSLLSLACMLSFSALACEPDFEAYNELEGLRVLAVRADPPELTSGTITTLDALLFHAPAEAPELQWSLCPWPSDPNQGFLCPVDRAIWARAWRNAGLGGKAPELALGSKATANLAFPGNVMQARKLCEALTAELRNSPTLPPDCDTRFPWTVRLSARLGASRIDTVKDVDLLLDDSLEPNRNPELTKLRVQKGKDSKPLEPSMPAMLEAGVDHDLRVEVASDAVETYIPTPGLGEPVQEATEESLTFTWFVDQGSTERVRSTYKEGVESMPEATKNEWHAPDKAGDAQLIVVVRDHRGGVGFLKTTVSFAE